MAFYNPGVETREPWREAALAAAKTTFGASFFPLAAALALAVGRTYGAAMAVLVPGGVLFIVALVATIGLAIAGGRGAAPWIGGALASLFAQGMVLVLVAMGWASYVDHRGTRPPRHRSAPARGPSRVKSVPNP